MGMYDNDGRFKEHMFFQLILALVIIVIGAAFLFFKWLLS